ncbi:MAG: TonB-dependent receptor, partial [Bacteroidota bacterium]
QEAEVVFGPGSVMYGSDAIGGVMDFHTLRPVFAQGDGIFFKANAMGRYSSANSERTTHIDFNIGAKKWTFLTSITRSAYDDLRMGSDGPEEYTRPDYVVREDDADITVVNDDPDVQVGTSYDQWNAMQKISFQPNDWTNLSYAFHYSRTSDYGRYDRLIQKDAGKFTSGEWYYGPQKWMMHSLNLRFSKPTALFDETRLILALQDFEESRHNRGFGATRRTDRTEKVRAFSVNLDLDKKLSDLITFYYGTEFVTNSVNSIASRQHVTSGEITPASTRYPDGADWRSFAGYISLKIKPNEKWLINLSNRFTSVYTHAVFDKTFFNFQFDDATLKNKSLNGSIGLVYSPSTMLKLYSNLSSGFRAPNVDDIGKVFDSAPGNVVVPNSALEPERAYNIEAGLAAFLGDAVKVDLTAYHTTMDNAIARGPSTFNGQDSIDYDGVLSRVLSQQNIGEVQIWGVQAGIHWQLSEALAIRSNLNIQKGKEKDPTTGENFSPTHVAPTFGSTNFVYSRNRLRAELYAVYNGEIAYDDLALTERADRHLYAQDGNGNPYAPSWWTLNAKAQYGLNKYLSFSAGVENILDKRYRPYSSGITAAGLNFILSVRATF